MGEGLEDTECGIKYSIYYPRALVPDFNYQNIGILDIRDHARMKSRQALEMVALSHVKKTVSKKGNGSYEIHLLRLKFKDADQENKFIAEKKTHFLVNKTCTRFYV
ncbi:hypothetical protein TNCV_2418711 [Trichonephila clavipes]|nr:hypothetical protein TNCV_2418711 [Trichonephila clavipes]